MKALWIGAAAVLAASAARAAPCDTVIQGESVAIAAPGHPFAAVPSRDGCTLYASLTATGGGRPGLAVLTNEGGGFHLSRTIPLRGQPTGLALSPDGATVAIADGRTSPWSIRARPTAR